MNKTEASKTATPIGQRVVRAFFRVTTTLAVIGGAAAAVQYGAVELTQRAEAAPTPAAAPVTPVSASRVAFQGGYDVRRAFIGQVEPQKTVAMSFELAGRLQDILVEEGDEVARGQVLALQDAALLNAERRRLEASREATLARLTFAEQTVARSSELTRRGHAAQAALDGALSTRDELHARIAEIDASLANVGIRLAKLEITAPFDGRVTMRQADGGEALAAGQNVLELVEVSAPRVRVGVPLDVAEADLFRARIEIAGADHDAKLIALRPDIDPVTRTRTAIFEVDAKAAFGQSARLLTSSRIEARGFWVPLTSLKEGLRGQWTVLAVDAEGMVRNAPVEVLHAETQRVYVRGAFPEGALLIDEGPQRVTVGQQVAVTMSE